MKRYVVIDIGCYECGVGHEVVSTHITREGAKAAAEGRNRETGYWRDGGSTEATVFEVEFQ